MATHSKKPIPANLSLDPDLWERIARQLKKGFGKHNTLIRIAIIEKLERLEREKE